MTTLIKKRKSGIDYYYAVKSGRVDGQPRIIWQKYLGRVEDVVDKLADGTVNVPGSCASFEFGGPVALLDIADKLGIEAVIDKQVPKRSQGPSVGRYILLAALNRALDPTSKNQIGDWYRGTVLQRLWGYSADHFSSQNFWNHMDHIKEEDITAIEVEVVRRVVKQEKLDLESLVYDTTNFFTFIDSSNYRNKLAQRGHSKAKRNDLRQIGLALVISRAFRIPLLHQVYEGNINDSTQFRSTCASLAERYSQLSGTCETLTLIFDKGNNSQEGLLLSELNNIHFVGSLVPSRHPELLDIPLSKFKQVDNEKWPGVRAYRTRCEAMGQEREVVITFSESFYGQQLHGWSVQLTKTTSRLEALNKALVADGKSRSKSKESIAGKVKLILQPLPFAKCIATEIKEQQGKSVLKYHTDTNAFQKFVNERGGKTILFTDRTDWSTEAIIAAYRGQAEIESTFRLLKADDFLRWQPMFHWTDSKIRVHALYCILALMMVSVLNKHLHDAGCIITPQQMLDALSGMTETILFYPSKRGPSSTSTTYTRLNTTQSQLFKILELHRRQQRSG